MYMYCLIISQVIELVVAGQNNQHSMFIIHVFVSINFFYSCELCNQSLADESPWTETSIEHCTLNVLSCYDKLNNLTYYRVYMYVCISKTKVSGYSDHKTIFAGSLVIHLINWLGVKKFLSLLNFSGDNLV